MLASNFNLDKYLQRINFTQELKSDLQTVSLLMSLQTRHISFDNKEVQAGKIPSLVPENIFTKLVENKQGGYCYELNALFAMVLEQLNIEYFLLAARPMFYPMKRPKTHMALAVKINDLYYLCDTGFGGYGIREPILINDNTNVIQGTDKFQIKLIEDEFVLSAFVGDEWLNQYGFELRKQDWIEFSLANYFNATSPDTIFTQKKLAVLQTANGRIILVDNELKLIENGNVEKISIAYEEAFDKYFIIKNTQ